jgi:hypothetical protein
MPRLPGHAVTSVGRVDSPGSLGLLGDFESHHALKLSRQRVQKSVGVAALAVPLVWLCLLPLMPSLAGPEQNLPMSGT